MGKPENQEDFEVFEVDGISVYIEKGLLEKDGERVNELQFYLEGYGRYKIFFLN